MKIWMRKMAVAFVAVLTLGLYIPSFDVTTEAEKDESTYASTKEQHAPIEQTTSYDIAPLPEIITADQLIEKAKEQTYVKLGSKITPKLDEEFTTFILPKMEEELTRIFEQAGDEKLPYYKITENVADGYGERIFNVHDVAENKAIAKFHVRREHRPQDGYWFNFHYHLKEDKFATHYDLGDIYWDKNQPPKWMS